MSEKKKLDDSRKASSGEHVTIPSPSDSDSAADLDRAGQFLGSEGEAEPAASGAVPDALDEEGIGAFAESVVSGLEIAGFEADGGAETSDRADTTAGELHEPSEAFFTGWDGPDEKEEHRSSSASLADYETGTRTTLSEIGIAASLQGRGFAGGTANKHDELADAVQSALFSVYGDPSPKTHASTFEDAPFPSIAHPSAGADAQLSPQDLILNYFDYNPLEHAPGGSWPEEHATQAYFRGESATHRPQRRGETSSYDGPPAYALPVAAPGFGIAAGAAKQRQSGRLIGAAGIGLVAGLAIAASWAYVTLTGTQVARGSATAGLEESGYGPSIMSTGEGEKLSSLATADSYSEIAAQDIVANVGQPAPLAINVKSRRLSDQALVNISGLPEGARLNAGIDAGGGSWLLPPRRLDGLTINLPSGAPRTVPLEVQLLDGIARTPLSEKRQFVVRLNTTKPDPAAYAAVTQGAAPSDVAPPEPDKEEQNASRVSNFNTEILSAPPQKSAAAQSLEAFKAQTVPAQPAQQSAVPSFQTSLAPGSRRSGSQNAQPQTASRAEAEDLIREGNRRMREGDIVEARQFYQKAVALGDPEAALAMGRSYDPIYFARIGKKNAEPDPAKAFDWYRKAMDGGAVQTARVRIENLKHFLNE